MDEVLTKWEEMGYTFRPLSDFTGGDKDSAEGTGEQNGAVGRILQEGNVTDGKKK